MPGAQRSTVSDSDSLPSATSRKMIVDAIGSVTLATRKRSAGLIGRRVRRSATPLVGAIYDLASVLIGGPWGSTLRGESFARAHADVAAAFPRPSRTRVNTREAISPHRAGRKTSAAPRAAVDGQRARRRRLADRRPRRLQPPQPRADALALIARSSRLPPRAKQSRRALRR
jgi:hypothetical protein